jgi:hypothetical protein
MNKEFYVASKDCETVAGGAPSSVQKSYDTMMELLNGPKVDRDPLPEIPPPDMEIFGISVGSLFDPVLAFFDTEEEAWEALRSSGVAATRENITRVGYYKELANKQHVISRTPVGTDQTNLYIQRDDGEVIGAYNRRRSIYRGEPVWEGIEGATLESEFRAFMDRGLEYQDNIFDRNQRRYDRIKQFTIQHLKNMK